MPRESKINTRRLHRETQRAQVYLWFLVSSDKILKIRVTDSYVVRNLVSMVHHLHLIDFIAFSCFHVLSKLRL